MNGAASVHSIPMLREFRAALATFATEAKESQSVNDMTVNRGLEWFQNDLLKFWQSEIRKREDAVTNAKAEYERCRMQSFGGKAPDCTDQKVALKKAQLRLEEAQEKLKRVKKWSRVLDEEAEEYRGQSQQLSDMMAGDMPKAIAELDRMLGALEAYLGVAAPMAGSETSMVNSTAEAPSTAPAENTAQSASAEPAKN
ncbi:MAG TPA: hypothetical protein VG826_04965 [Pirellulales bacterium]|nr:hypothetical protein [Pirellulales bacterium]